MAVSVFSSSTVCLKLAVIVLIVVLILQVVGFALPQWSTLKLDVSSTGLDVDSSYNVGLWRDCGCASLYGITSCACVPKQHVSGSFKAVQIMETLGLIGLIISGIMSLVILFAKQNKTLKCLNVVFVFSSGVIVLIGVIIYEEKCNGDVNELFRNVAEVLAIINVSTDLANLGTSFMLCAIAGSLGFLLCTLLLILDFRVAVPPGEQSMQSTHVQYSNQGQVIGFQQGQTQVVISATMPQQPLGYIQPYYAAQPSHTMESQENQPYLQRGSTFYKGQQL